MPEPHKRVRSKKHNKTKSSGGKTVIHYGSKKTCLPSCSKCGRTLHGITRQKPSKISKLPKNKKRVGRTYTGTLCHSCLRRSLREAARTL